MGLGEAELSPHHLWGSSQAWEHRLGFAFGLAGQRRAQGRKLWQFLEGWSMLGSREKAEGHKANPKWGHVPVGCLSMPDATTISW